MFGKIKPYFLLVLSLAIYFAVRLQNLLAIPVFADEAIYVRWSQIIKSVETLRFIPLSDGKQPLFMWLTVPFFKIFDNPLFAGRFVSIVAGSVTLVGLFVLFSIILYLFSHPKLNQNPFIFVLDSIQYSFPGNFIPVTIYTLLPFTFFFDRLALADSLLSAFGIWSLTFAILQSLYLRLDLSLISGIILGLAWLTKSPAIYFICLYLFTVIFLHLIYRPNSTRSISCFNLILYPLVSVIISFVIFNILRLGPQFSQIAARNLDYVWPITEIIKHPLDPLKPHLSDTFSLYGYFIGLPLFIISLTGWVLSATFHKIKLTPTILILILSIAAWWVLPLIANAAVAKVFTARYILFTVPPLILLLSLGVYYLIKTKPLFAVLFIFTIMLSSVRLYNFSLHPFDLQLPSTETGYISGWTSGWGIKQSAEYLINRSFEANVIVGSEGYFGTLPDGLQIYTNQVKQLTIVPIGLNITEIPDNLINAKNYGDEVYLLFNQSRLKLSSDQFNKLKIVQKFEKPDNDPLLLIQI